jgi:hypothetical protein
MSDAYLWVDHRPSTGFYFRIHQEEVRRALVPFVRSDGTKAPKGLSKSALVLWLFLGTELTGNFRGWRIGRELIEQFTGYKKAQIYKALAELKAAQFVEIACEKCKHDPKPCETTHERSTLVFRLV